MCTREVDLVGVAQFDRGNVELLVGDRREEGNHVKVAVVADRSHFLWETVVFWEAPHPFLEYGVCEGM